ncbi:MAG: nucleotide exchange factor GrpE [Bacteroidota bacterium]
MSKKNKEQKENLNEQAKNTEENKEQELSQNEQEQQAEEAKDQEGQQNTDEQKETQNNDTKETEKTPEQAWEDKYNELNDKHLRLFSEFDNYRKRTIREKSDLIKSASADLIKEMLPLIDDMERALDNIPEEQEEARKGMELIRDKFLKILKQKGLKEMDSKGEEFDTDYHEAVTQIPAPEEEMKGKVVDVVEKGYILNDKVLRFAKVVVGK